MPDTSLHYIEAALSAAQRAAEDTKALARNREELNQGTLKEVATSVGAVVAQLQDPNELGLFGEDQTEKMTV